MGGTRQRCPKCLNDCGWRPSHWCQWECLLRPWGPGTLVKSWPPSARTGRGRGQTQRKPASEEKDDESQYNAITHNTRAENLEAFSPVTIKIAWLPLRFSIIFAKIFSSKATEILITAPDICFRRKISLFNDLSSFSVATRITFFVKSFSVRPSINV